MMIFLKNILIILTIIKLYDSYYIRNRKISKSGKYSQYIPKYLRKKISIKITL